MTTLLPSGVSIVPVVARSEKFGPFVQTIPIGAAEATAGPKMTWPAPRASTSPSSRVALVTMLAFLLRADIGLVRLDLDGESVLVRAYLGHHPAASRSAVVAQLAGAAVLEEVDVVRSAPVRAPGSARVVLRRREEHIARFTGPHVEGVRPVHEVGARRAAEKGRVLTDDPHADARQLHRMLLIAEVREPKENPVASVALDQRRDRLARKRRVVARRDRLRIDAAVEREVIRVVAGVDRLLDQLVVVMDRRPDLVEQDRVLPVEAG